MSEQSPNHALAEVKSFPQQPYLCIEFPGYIKNPDKALETLGGISGISAAHNAKQSQIPLNFRPHDPWSHPIFLDRCMTSNFVLEVTKTTNEATGETQLKGEIVGNIPQTYTFTGLADFQYLPHQLNDPPMDPLSDQDPMRAHLQTTQHFPPPIFSKTDHPHPYNFEPNSWFKLVEKSGENGTTERQFQARKTPTALAPVPTIPWEEAVVPDQPSELVEAGVMEDVVALLKVMYENDPILSRTTIESRFSKYSWAALVPSVHRVAYTFSSGPWRASWVKLGYDPRQDSSSRRYQTIDFRVDKDMIRGKALVENTRKPPSEKPQRINQARNDPAALANRQVDPAERRERHKELKFLKPPSQLQTMYSLHEIELDGLSEILSRPASQRCTRELGWFTKKNLEAVRDLMKRGLPRLIREWDSGEFAAKMRAEEREEEEVELPTPNPTQPATSSQSRSLSSASEMLQSIAQSAHLGTRSDSLDKITAQIADGDDEELFGLLEDD